MNEPPTGQRISLAYYPKPPELRESSKFRVRVLAFVTNNKLTNPLNSIIPEEIGRPLKWGPAGINWNETFGQLSIIELFDALTFLMQEHTNVPSSRLFKFIERALREEALAYRLDELGGFHPLIDQSFEHERVETIRGLSEGGYGAAAKAYADAMHALTPSQPDTLGAVRNVIDAVENVFKVATGQNRIGATEIKSALPPFFKSKIDSRARDASARLVASFAEWANASHQYRHADAHPDPTPPPIDLAIQFMSAGSGWLRWLIALDKAKRAELFEG